MARRTFKMVEVSGMGRRFCFGQATTIQPSAVGKVWNGTIEGCAELRVRCGT